MNIDDLHTAFFTLGSRTCKGLELANARTLLGLSERAAAEAIGRAEGRINLTDSAVRGFESQTDPAPFWYRYALRDLVQAEIREVERCGT